MIMAQLHLQDLPHREALHDRLIQVLDLPDHYGRNLDALYDILTERGEQTILWIYPAPQADLQMGGYLSALLDTLQDAAAENPALSLCVVEPGPDAEAPV